MITVVGVGALGSHVVQLLRNETPGLRIIDFDRVEQKNTLSQFHARPSVGKSKVASVQQTMLLLFGLKVAAVPHKLIADNVLQLLGGSTLIVDCLDNGQARRLVQGYARSTHTPCVHGALAADATFGRVVWDEAFVVDDEGGSGGTATCEDGAHLPFIALVSSVLAFAARQFIVSRRQGSFLIYPTGSIVPV